MNQLQSQTRLLQTQEFVQCHFKYLEKIQGKKSIKNTETSRNRLVIWAQRQNLHSVIKI